MLAEKDIPARISKEKLFQLRQIFKIIRTISILSIDGHYSHSPTSIDIPASLLAMGSGTNVYRGQTTLDTLAPFLSLLHDELYLDANVLGLQRLYEIAALEVLSNARLDYEAAIESSFHKGLVESNLSQVTHFLRFRIPEEIQARKSLFDEFRYLQRVKKRVADVEVSVDVNPITNVRYADVYIKSAAFNITDLPVLVYNLSTLLEEEITFLIGNFIQKYFGMVEEPLRQIRSMEVKNVALEDAIISSVSDSAAIDSWEEFKSKLLPAFRELLWSTIHFFIDQRYVIDIKLHYKSYDVFGMKLPSRDMGLLDKNFDMAIDEEKGDADRQLELVQLRKSACRKWDGYVFACLARITVSDVTKPPSQHLVTDIDGVVLKVSQDRLILEFHESKNVGLFPESRAKKDLRNKLMPILNDKAIGARIESVKGSGAKLSIQIQLGK